MPQQPPDDPVLVKELDLTEKDAAKDVAGEDPAGTTSVLKPVLTDLEPGRDVVRAKLALGLLGLLAVIIVGAGVILAFEDAKTDASIEVLKLVFTPVVALAGSAMGFYFGAGSGAPRSPDKRE